MLLHLRLKSNLIHCWTIRRLPKHKISAYHFDIQFLKKSLVDYPLSSWDRHEGLTFSFKVVGCVIFLWWLQNRLGWGQVIKDEGNKTSLLLPNQPLPTNQRSGEYREAKLTPTREKREVYILADEHALCMLVIAQFVYTVTHLRCCSLFFRESRPSSRAKLCFLWAHLLLPSACHTCNYNYGPLLGML